MKTLRVITFVSSALFLSGCDSLTYNPDGNNYKDISIPQGNISIYVSQIEDTAYAWGTTEIHYNLELEDKEFRNVVCYLNDEQVAESSNPEKLRLYTTNYPDGIYQVSLMVTAYSGSNSLADQLQLEYIYALKEFVLIIQNDTPPVAVSIQKAENFNGSLKITWKKYLYQNFKEYKIYVISKSYSGYLSEKLLTKIDSVNSLDWIDKGYVGGEIKYRIDTGVINGPDVTGQDFQFNSKLPSVIKWEEPAEGEIKLTWSKCIFDSSFKGYILNWQRYPWSENYYDVLEIADINDTTIIRNDFGFGAKRKYFITTIGNNKDRPAFSIKTAVYKGIAIPGFKDIKYIPALNSLYLISADSTLRLDYATNEVLAKYNRKVEISYDGSRAYTLINEQRIEEIDPLTFSQIREIDLSAVFRGNPLISDIFIGMSNSLYLNRGDFITYISTDTIKILSELTATGWHWPQIYRSSAHGFLIHTHDPYDYSFSNRIVEVDLSKPEISNSGLYVNDRDYMAFSFDNDMDMVIDTHGNRIWTAKYKPAAYEQYDYFDVEKEINKPSKDHFSDLLGGLKSDDSNQYIIYDLKSKSVFKEIRLMDNWSTGISSKPELFIIDSKIYSNNGLYMVLEN